MNSHRNSALPRRTNLTNHRRATADPTIRGWIRELKQQWEHIDRIELGYRLRELVGLGCSTRGLADGLGKSQTTVRRYMDLTSLPAGDQHAVSAGASAKKAFAKKALHEQQRFAVKRLSYEHATGALSDEVADLVLDFCRGNYVEHVFVMDSELRHFLFSVAMYLSRPLRSFVPSSPVPGNARLKTLFKYSRPPLNPEVSELEHQAEWLAAVLRSIAPERKIWEAAVRKANDRAGELNLLAHL